jgi:hypothetical protein
VDTLFSARQTKKIIIFASLVAYIALTALVCNLLNARLGPPLQPTLAPKYSAVKLPDDYRRWFHHYETIERVDGTIRDIYINPGMMRRIRPGGALPDNTVIVIEAYHAQRDAEGKWLRDKAGHFIKGEPFEMIHVMEKRPTWRPTDFPDTLRAGQWNFGSFDFRTHERFNESLNACFNCHNATDRSDFVHTYFEILDFITSGETQYRYCNLTGRIAC